MSAPPRSPAPWESGQGAAGRPPLGPGCATAPRAPAGDERVAGGGTAGHARTVVLLDDGPSVAVGQGARRRAPSRDAPPPRAPWAPLDMGTATRPQRSGTPAAASLPPAQAITTPTDAVRQRCPARQRRHRRNVRECRRYHATAASSRTPPCLSYGRWSSHP